MEVRCGCKPHLPAWGKVVGVLIVGNCGEVGNRSSLLQKESGMGRPSLFETAIKEWGLVRDEVLDIHTAVFGRRSFGNVFISAVVEYCDILLTEKSPEWHENYWQIIAEIKRLRELAMEMQDENSDFMKEYGVKIQLEYDLS